MTTDFVERGRYPMWTSVTGFVHLHPVLGLIHIVDGAHASFVFLLKTVVLWGCVTPSLSPPSIPDGITPLHPDTFIHFY